MTYIWHVALGVGMGTREARGHLSDTDLADYGAHIRRGIAAYPKGDPIIAYPAYTMSAQNIRGVLLCAVGRRANQLALATFSVVLESSQAAKAWQALHDGYPQFAPSLGDVPRTPYCAARAEYGLALDRDAGAWLDGYQVAIAWAWREGIMT